MWLSSSWVESCHYGAVAYYHSAPPTSGPISVVPRRWITYRHEADRALERVAYPAEVAVLAAESTTAAALRQAVAEGRASRDELVALGRSVVDQVLAQLDTETRKALSETVGDIRRYVEQLIEAALERYKAQGVVGRVSELAAPKS